MLTNLNRFIRKEDNRDLTKEHRTCSFDTDEMTFEIYGGKEKAIQKREIVNKVFCACFFARAGDASHREGFIVILTAQLTASLEA